MKAAFTEPDTVVVPDNTRAQSDPNLASGTETANEHYRVNCIGPSWAKNRFLKLPYQLVNDFHEDELRRIYDEFPWVANKIENT